MTNDEIRADHARTERRNRDFAGLPQGPCQCEICQASPVAQGDGKTTEEEEQFDCAYCARGQHWLGQEIEILRVEGGCSVSLLQRRCRYGYAHALEVCRQLEARGYIKNDGFGKWSPTCKITSSVSPGTAANKTEADSGIKEAHKALSDQTQNSLSPECVLIGCTQDHHVAHCAEWQFYNP